MTDDYNDEIVELVDQILNVRENRTVTLVRGILICEVFVEGNEERSLQMVRFGRQMLAPWDVFGLLEAARVHSDTAFRINQAKNMDDEDDGGAQ